MSRRDIRRNALQRRNFIPSCSRGGRKILGIGPMIGIEAGDDGRQMSRRPFRLSMLSCLARASDVAGCRQADRHHQASKREQREIGFHVSSSCQSAERCCANQRRSRLARLTQHPGWTLHKRFPRSCCRNPGATYQKRRLLTLHFLAQCFPKDCAESGLSLPHRISKQYRRVPSAVHCPGNP